MNLNNFRLNLNCQVTGTPDNLNTGSEVDDETNIKNKAENRAGRAPCDSPVNVT